MKTIRKGCLASGCLYVFGVVLVVFFVLQEMLDLFEQACPACFGR